MSILVHNGVLDPRLLLGNLVISPAYNVTTLSLVFLAGKRLLAGGILQTSAYRQG